MKRKMWIISIGIVLMLVFSSLPMLQSVSTDTGEEIEKPHMVKIRVCRFQEGGVFEEVLKELTTDENKEMMNKLMQTEIADLTPKEMFEGKLEILKEYDIVSGDIVLDDIVDVEKLERFSPQTFDVSEMEPFVAHFAPIFIGGFGFGAGFGFRRLPMTERIAGNIFSAGVIGLGAVLCFDVFAGTLYYQLTFTVPLLVHVLAGFVGIMLFAFDNLFPAIPGKPPVTLYSNIVALGMAGLAIGFMIPPVEN